MLIEDGGDHILMLAGQPATIVVKIPVLKDFTLDYYQIFLFYYNVQIQISWPWVSKYYFDKLGIPGTQVSFVSKMVNWFLAILAVLQMPKLFIRLSRAVETDRKQRHQREQKVEKVENPFTWESLLKILSRIVIRM